MRKILVLASNPRRDLNLDREIRDLQGVIDRSRNRDQLEVQIGLAVRSEDLQELLLKHDPQIVHFCGHGGGEQGLILQDVNNRERWVSTDALCNLFALFTNQIECVVLNACYSEIQVNAIVKHINYGIGVRREIQDDAAIAFTTGFYRALGYGRSIEQSYAFGCNEVQLQMFGSSPVRSVVSEEQRRLEVLDIIQTSTIPEHLKPILKRKDSPTFLPENLLSKMNGNLSSTTQLDIQVNIDRALEKEMALKQYRKRVREFLIDRELSDVELSRLELLRGELNLSIRDTKKILKEEQEPIWRERDKYRKVLIDLIQQGCSLRSQKTRSDLRNLQAELKLSDKEVREIKKTLFDQTNEEKLQQKQTNAPRRPKQKKMEALQIQNQAQTKGSRRESIHQPPLKSFVFEIAKVEASKKRGLFGFSKIEPSISRYQATKEYFLEDLDGSQSLTMVSIPAGKFWMGLLSGDEGQSNWESPSHLVEIHPFFMSRYPVTQAQWKAVAAFRKVKLDLNPDPSHFKGGDRPVESVSWDEAVEFCNRLARKTGRNYRLPSEAEWEYACRAGTRTPFHFGEAITPDLVNFEELNRQGTTPVGHFGIANNFGLSDMHGNVWEWCADCWHENYEGAPRDGSAWSTGGDVNCRILRGGAWCHPSKRCRSAYRFKSNPQEKTDTYGLRVVCADL